jgi:UDP-3-O-[3-hydroxymyristoyl] glucosamine N-acyltransferase
MRKSKQPKEQPNQQIAPDVKLGKGVRIYGFTNLYGCEIGDDVKIGTFVEIQKGRRSGTDARFQATASSAKG